MAAGAFGKSPPFDSRYRPRGSSRRHQHDSLRRSSEEEVFRTYYNDTLSGVRDYNVRPSRSRPPPNSNVYDIEGDFRWGSLHRRQPELHDDDAHIDIERLVLESDSGSSSSSGDDTHVSLTRYQRNHPDGLRGRSLGADTLLQDHRARSLSLSRTRRAGTSYVRSLYGGHPTIEVDPPRIPPHRLPLVPPSVPPRSPSPPGTASVHDYDPLPSTAPNESIPPRSGRPKVNQNASFRLVDLMPGNTYDPMYARLYRFDSFETAPPYEALSYVWGNTRLPPVYIELTGRSFAVTQNLYSALRSLRYETQSRLLWIDAICINQWDNVEKSYQVRIMGHIYANARRVLGYTGEEDSHATAIMIACRNHQIFPGIREHLAVFMARPWFHRTWVIQEALLAQDLALHCGSSRANFKDFIQLYQRVHGVPRAISRPRNLMELKAWYDGRRPRARTFSARIFGSRPDVLNGGNADEASIGCLPFTDIVEMLQATTIFECRDKRDKVYALLSLFAGRIPARLKPNYNKSVNEVFEGVIDFLSERDVLYDWFADAPCRYDHGAEHWDEHGGCVECYGAQSQDMIRPPR